MELKMVSAFWLTYVENQFSLTMKLMGGKKKKRKKKIFTKPKRIPHKHRDRPKAVLDYYTVDQSGKVSCIKQQSPKCKPATFMADHQDRFVCGQTGTTFFKLTKDRKRLPIPKQLKPKDKTGKVAVVEVKGKKKGKK
jgi:ribosomal protein S27AE